MNETTKRPSRIAWFEIPAADFDRAVHFYEAIFAAPMQRMAWGDGNIAVFRYDEPHISGSVTCEEGMKPDPHGVLVHLNADPLLDDVLARVEPAGGAILVGRTALPPGMGFGAKIRDTEGNTVGLHAMA